MSDEPPTNAKAPAGDAIGFIPDRRRPGRIDKVDASLIPLMRGEFLTRVSAESMEDETPHPMSLSDDLRPLTGIAVGTLLSSVFWLALAVVL